MRFLFLSSDIKIYVQFLISVFYLNISLMLFLWLFDKKKFLVALNFKYHLFQNRFVASFLKRLFIFIFRERGIEGEKHRCARDTLIIASRMPPTGDLALSPGMCPDLEQNQRPFGSQAGTQSTEPQQPGLFLYLSYYDQMTYSHS